MRNPARKWRNRVHVAHTQTDRFDRNQVRGKPEALRTPREEMGRRYAEYGAQNAHSQVVRDVLIATMARKAGNLWNDDVEDAWTTALNLVAGTMMAGARASQQKAA